MKKILFLLISLSLLFTSCSKNERTYSVLNDVDVASDIIVNEYNENNECVANHPTLLGPRESKSFVASERAEKIKIFIKRIGVDDYFDELNQWIYTVFYLDDNLEIVINEATSTSPEQP